MTELRPALRLYIGAVLISAVIAFGAAAVFRSAGMTDAVAFFLVGAFACAAQIRPLHLSSKLKIDVDDAATFAAALLFEPVHAMLLAGGAMLASRMWFRREPWYGHAFNIAVVVLAIGASSAAYRVVADTDFYASKNILATLAAGVALYVVRTVLMDLVVAMHLRRDPRANW